MFHFFFHEYIKTSSRGCWECINFSLPFAQNFKKEISSKTLTEGDAYQWEIVVNISFIMMSEMAFEIVCFDILSFSYVLETLNVIKVE